MSDGKREIIARLIEEYDIRSAEDIQNALRDLLGRTIQGMMGGEMETQKKESRRKIRLTLVLGMATKPRRSVPTMDLWK